MNAPRDAHTRKICPVNQVSAPTPARVVSLTRFPRTSEPHGTRQTAPLDALLDEFRSPRAAANTPKEELPLWSPATFAGDRRSNANVESAWAVGFDVDVSPVPDEHALQALPFAGFFCSSSSHLQRSDANPDATARWRLVVLLSRAVDAKEYARVWRAVARSLPFKVGDAKDPARQWFVPRRSATYAFGELAGAPVDVEAILAKEPEREDDHATVDLPSEGTWTVSHGQKSAFASLLAPAFFPGKRHHLTRALFGVLARIGASQSEAHEILGWIADDAEDKPDEKTRAKRLRMCADAFARARTGDTLEGRPSLEALAGEHAVAALAALDNRVAEKWKDAKIFAPFHAKARSLLQRSAANDLTASDVVGPRPRTAADRALALGGDTSVRLISGFPTLDRITRGGLPTGKLVAIGGAPGAGKTFVLVQWAFDFLSRGVHVGMLACDEDADGLLIRFGQLLGIDRRALEDGDVTAKQTLAEWARCVPLSLWDGDEDEMTLEDASQALRASAGSAPSVLLVDSLQTVRVEGPHGQTPRERIDAVVKASKHAAKVDRHLVIATSELARGAYRSKDTSEAINDLAAFKESGGIEYGIGLALVLRSRKGSNDLVDASVPKNRFGGEKSAFALRLNFDRASVREDSLVPALNLDNPLATYKDRILGLKPLQAGRGFTKTALAQQVSGKRASVMKAVDELLGDGKLFEGREGIRLPLPADPVPGYALEE